VSGGTRLLKPYVRREWRALATVAGTTAVAAAAELARPLPLALVVNVLITRAGDGPSGFELRPGDLWLLGGVAGLVLAIALVDGLATYVADIKLKRAGERITHDLRLETHAELQRLSLGYHARRPAGDLVTRVTSDVHAVGGIFSESLGAVVASVLLLLGMLVVAAVIDPVLALTAFATAPLLALVSLRTRRRLKVAARRQRSREGEIAALTTETLGAIREVKALGSERLEHERLRLKSEERREAGIEAYRIESRYARLVDLVGAVGTAGVLVVGVLRVSAGAVSPAELVVMASYAKRLSRPLRDLARQAGRVTRAMARADRVAEILGSGEVLEERPGAYRGERPDGAIAFEGVDFSYEPGRSVLHGFTLHVPPGQRLSLVGPSGVGKSTVAALLARFYDPQGGRVTIDGRDLRDCSLDWLRGQVGLLLQEPILFTGTVAENIGYGIEASAEEIVAAASAAGAHEFVERLPDGYETLLGPRGEGLSGGQKQRLAIARTLLRDPAVLVLDEPTTGLDAESEEAVVGGLERLMDGRTVILVTHSPRLARLADRTVVLGHGRAGRRVPRPRDRKLPALSTLLDPVAMAPRLGASLNGGSEPTDVKVRYLRYKPETNIVVHYDVGLDGGTRHDAIAMIAAGGSLARRAAKPESIALAQLVRTRVPAAVPLSYDPELGCLVQWYPLDLSLPALAHSPTQLRKLLDAAGVAVERSDADPERLAYKPRRRAVLRVDGHVLKLYRRRSEFERALAGQRTASALRSIVAPRLEAALMDRLVTVQSLLPGRVVPSAASVAADAGGVLALLHASRPDGLPALVPAAQLEASAASARLVATIAPELRPRLDRLLGRLASMPRDVTLVPSHGDFSARQLLVRRGVLAVTDFDEFCLAPKALDPATFAAYFVRGRPGDLDAALAALADLCDGYGARPPHLSWYLATMILRRAARPFRYLEPDWHPRVEEMVTSAERAAAAEPVP
jgi:ATP-binding cassette, subfamily B, bacterial